LVTIMQLVENLSDRQAADAVRGRLDWKYALGLELSDPGFDASVLSEFRTRLIAGQAEEQVLTAMLTLFKERGWLKARGQQRTDSTHVLAKIRAINRLVCVGETLRPALNCLAIVAPDWLQAHSEPEWVDRYGVRIDDSRLAALEAERQAWAERVGHDGSALLSALFDPGAPVWLREVPAVGILRQVWVQNHQWTEGQLAWRAADNLPPATLYVSSPYDLQAHSSKKRTTSWVGYKVHLTETCAQDQPHLITHVDTTTAPVSDDARTASIHAGLQQKELEPAQHLVDTGYVDAQLLHQSQTGYEIDLVGPTRADDRWQSQQKTGFAAGQFQIDWAAEQATCPEGHTSISWTPALDNRQNEVIKIKFSSDATASLVPVARCVRMRGATRAARSRCVQSCTTRRYSGPGSAPRPRNSKRSMPAERAWKEPSHQESGLWACGVPATLAKNERISSILPPLLR
jgi:transposase